jgi:hypothetical protein
MARVVAVLVEMRSLAEAKKFEMEKFTSRWADIIDIPPLLIEMWSS